jgi:U4/U6.U5 tri-snRNP-associated protein 1
MSLSIDETNKLRASLGLKPLTNDASSTDDPNAPAKSLNSDENFVHRPAANMSEKKRSDHVMEKLSLHKEKRMLQSKFMYVISKLRIEFLICFVFLGQHQL